MKFGSTMSNAQITFDYPIHLSPATEPGPQNKMQHISVYLSNAALATSVCRFSCGRFSSDAPSLSCRRYGETPRAFRGLPTRTTILKTGPHTVVGVGARGKVMHTAEAREEDEEDDKGEAEDEEEGDEEDEQEGSLDEEELFDRKKANYPHMAAFLEEAFKDDREIREIIGDSVGDTEDMRKRIEERVKRKKVDMLQAKTGSASPMKVSFNTFNATDAYIWFELCTDPAEKDIDILGSVIRSWYLLGCLGGYNSLNMQLTRIPVNERLSYNENVEDEILPARFHNIGELEFQHNLGRFWIDMGTSDPLAMDMLINALSAVSSDYVGVKELTFGGQDSRIWNEDMTLEDEGYKSFKL